jgi:hypothetical protein
MVSEPRSSRPDDEVRAKKEYRRPELRVYGDIRAITQTASGGTMGDGGKGAGTDKTA